MPSSPLLPGELVIHDGTPEHAHTDPTRGRGFCPGVGFRSTYDGVADPLPASLLVPRSEWQARIAEMVERKSLLSDLIRQGGLPCKDQARTNYCWFNAPSHCLEVVRLLQNEPTVILSAASGAAPLTNYARANFDPAGVGGFGPDALAWIAEHGLVPESAWPANVISPKYATPENKALALKYRAAEWFSTDNGDMDQLISLLLRRIPVAVGYTWWGHEVTAVDPVWLDGTFAVRIRNSWGMDWPTAGAGGFAVLQGRKMVPSDAVAPKVAVAS